MPLTDTALRNAKSRERDYKMFDAAGLHVLVTRSGSKLWRMKYRYRGKEKLLSFGPYPLVSLKLARERRDEARLMLLEDRDPSEEKKLARIEKDRERAITFGSVAQEYLDKVEKEGRAPATLKKLRWLISQIGPQLQDRPIRQIEAPDVLRELRKVEAKGNYETTRRLRSTIGSVFQYAISTGRAAQDPSDALKGALIRPKVRSRSAILDRRELGELLSRIDGFGGQPATMHALNLLTLLAPRPGELRLARWHEFDFEEAIWRIPAERTKMRRPHRVPLAPQAIARLEELSSLTGSSELLLPSVRSWVKPISKNTLNAALKRMGYSSDRITAHGFRATFSTFANESGLLHPDAVERALAHVEENEVRRAYVRGEHWDERVRMGGLVGGCTRRSEGVHPMTRDAVAATGPKVEPIDRGTLGRVPILDHSDVETVVSATGLAPLDDVDIKQFGYHRRSRVETKMHCVKLLGQRLMARDFDRQVAELQVRIAVLNGYTALGIPVTEAVG